MIRKVFVLVGLSSYLLAAPACTITGDGISILPSVQNIVTQWLGAFGLTT